MTSPAAPPAKTVTVTVDLTHLPSAVTALGVALLSAAIAFSAYYSRNTGELDGSTFAMGCIATAALLAIAAGSHLLIASAETRGSLVSWPGAAGIIGAGTMLAVQVENGQAAAYGAGAIILIGSVLSYAVTKAAPFVLSTILGLGVLYIRLFDDVIDVDGDGKNLFIIIGAGIVVFVGVVTAVGWSLPRTRVLSSVVVGAAGIAALAMVFQFMAIFTAISAFSSDLAFDDAESSYYDSSSVEFDGSVPSAYPNDVFEVDESGPAPEGSFFESSPYRDDIKVILAYSAALALFWALCSVLTGHVAFRILSVTIVLLSVPASAIALAVSHPTWWQVALTGAGGLLLGLAGIRVLRSDREPVTQTSS